ncbi:hypothetical protein ACN27E_24835 [Mycobacterium sp. WMMD1722]|uniref:hypothetical protein n=1 Tax=Mycobacterium sp. WMMD1722 TaxID=3404117 RepID=UPI003BF4AC44
MDEHEPDGAIERRSTELTLSTRLSRHAESAAPTSTAYTLSTVSESTASAPRHVLSAGELFLGGNYIELGISTVGSFGTAGGKPEGFTGGNPPGGHENSIGLSYDVDGYGHGSDAALDFFVPDAPEERWSIGIDNTRFAGFSALAGTAGNATSLTNTALTDNSSGNVLSASFSSTVDESLRVTQTHTFNTNDSYWATTVTLTNVSGVDLANVEFMRSFDPDGTRSVGGDNTTVNTVLGQFETDGFSMVSAASLEGDAYDTLTGSRAVIFLYSRDPRAIAYTGGFTNANPYEFDNLNQSNGYTTTADDAIGIVFKAGNMTPGSTVTFTYYTGATTDDDPNIIEQQTGGSSSTVETFDSDASGVNAFYGNLNAGWSLAGFSSDVAEVFRSNTLNPGVKRGITLGSFLLGIRDMISGRAQGDAGRELSGLIDSSSAVVGLVSPPLSVAAQIAKTYAAFWVPISNEEQTAFLNFISQCAFHKNSDRLTMSESTRVLNRYQGALGLANLLSDHSLYTTRGLANLLGQSGCPS